MPRSLLPLAALCLALVLPARAQWTVAPYLATDTGYPGSATLVGASVLARAGAAGARLSLSVDAGATAFGAAYAPGRPAAGLWSLDADALAYVWGRPETHDLVPYVVAGVGVRGERARSGGAPVLTGGTGAGLHLQVTDRFSLSVEGRYRAPLAAPEGRVPAGLSGGWEYRMGLGIRLGRHRSPAPPRSAPRHAPLPPSPAPLPTPPRAVAPAPPAETPHAALVRRTLASAEAFLGVPYVWGGTSPTKGFDCSGFVQHVYRRHGVTLPRVSRDQAHAGVAVPARLGLLQPGDLLFFASNGARIDHVAIYAGDDRILHASKSKGGVGYDDLWSARGAWYRDHFVAARRVLNAPALPADGPAAAPAER